VAGLLLHSELALKGSGVPGPIADRLRVVAELAGTLRQQLSSPLNTTPPNVLPLKPNLGGRSHTAA
jgi:hypothetical protein